MTNVSLEDAERIVRDRLDDIGVDENSRCHWAEVANAITFIVLELKAAQQDVSWRPIDNEIFTLQCAVENLRAPERTERTVDAAWRIASDLEKIVNRLANVEQ